jgi:hypothetical protein
MQKVTLTANCTITFTNADSGKKLFLEVIQDGTGSRTITWPASAKWSGGTAPTLTTTASKTDVFSFAATGAKEFAQTYGLNY